MDEPIYTEQDMVIARNAMEKFRKDAQDAQKVVWAIVTALGGSFAIPERLLIEVGKENSLTTWTDAVNGEFVIQAK